MSNGCDGTQVVDSTDTDSAKVDAPATSSGSQRPTRSAPRRTQAERSATTRARLLEATVATLVEKGWSGTSTTEVVRRAGVSRGAQVHHFPAKEELVLAAVEHLLETRMADFRAAFAAVPGEERSPGVALELMWTRCFGSSFDAWLELAVAARTDPALHRPFVELEARFFEAAVASFRELFPEIADEAFARTGLRLAFCVLDGLALNRLIGVDSEHLAEIRSAFASLVDPLFPPGSPPHPPDLAPSTHATTGDQP